MLILCAGVNAHFEFLSLEDTNVFHKMMDINYFGPRKKNVKYKYFNNLKKMAKYIDYLVITCAGGEKTKKLINAEILSVMKKNAYLINVSRGTVVDEKALLQYLQF